jgi:hypothetical protein
VIPECMLQSRASRIVETRWTIFALVSWCELCEISRDKAVVVVLYRSTRNNSMVLNSPC